MGEQTCRKMVIRRAGTCGWLACERCGKSTLPLSLHHRKKRSHLPRNRMWEVSNCVLLCGDGTTGCHGWVEDHSALASVEGFHVYSYEESRDIPVKLWHVSHMVTLNDQGGFDYPGMAEDNA